ncbi:MAG: UbiA family prenyltransferase [Nitrospirae bacterium]|nr:UbiA family prenyltransferase [Nitrospirota bacterium]
MKISPRPSLSERGYSSLWQREVRRDFTKYSLLQYSKGLPSLSYYETYKRLADLRNLSEEARKVAGSAAPLGSWIAVTGTFDPAVIPLAAAVIFWLAGFDVLYALQDIEFDRHAMGIDHNIYKRWS